MGSRGISGSGWMFVVSLMLACGGRPLQPGEGSQGGGNTSGGSGGAPRGGATSIGSGGLAAGGGSAASTGSGGLAAGGGAIAIGGAAGTGASGTGGGTPDAGGPPPRVLSLVLDSAPWYATQATQGIAADASGKVYVADYGNVYMVDGATVSTYLTAAEAADPGASSPEFGDLDIGPDGQLYVVASWFSSPEGTRLGVMRSSQPHQATWWVNLAPTLSNVRKMAVIDDGLIGVVSGTGYWTFTSTDGTQVYDQSAVQTCGGACEDLAAARSGVFLFQPGCNGSPILRGQSDGSGVGILYAASLLQPSTISADNFNCVARDPAGGFYFIAEDSTNNSPRLYHVTEDAQGATGLDWIETAPSFAEASHQRSNVFGFEFCSLAAAPDGTVYFQSYAQLWKVSP
jgi:hypothetical protein